MSIYRLSIEYRALPPMQRAGSSGTHWGPKHTQIKQIKADIGTLCLGAGLPKKPLRRALLRLTRCSSQVSDYDGLVASFKPCVDGLVEAGVLADDSMAVTGPWECRWEKAPRKKGFVKIEVVEGVENGD